MAKSKTVRMPAGIRNKLTAAIAMLLVSSIMMVSSTYAWFTLSTAPEVTGITTSVGANGNLEMALLNAEPTVDNLNAIASAVGNSSAVTTVQNANITWGNLVDLSDAVYGLQNISLLPARLNFKTTEGENITYSKDALNSVTGPLVTPTYGKDGRVATVDRPTYSTVFDSNGAWSFVEGSQTYGVRAIGTNDNLTPQQAGLIAAKAAYTNSLTSAKSAVQGALSANGNLLAGALTTLAMGSDKPLSEDQNNAIGALITASGTALGHIDSAYKQVLLAIAAKELGDVTEYNAAVSTINSAASFTAALAALPSGTVPETLTNAATALTAQQNAVNAAQSSYTGGQYNEALKALVDSTKVIINGYNADPAANGTDSGLRDEAGNIKTGELSSKLINDGGAIVEMPDGSGVFAYVGKVAGNYQASCKVDIDYSGINLTNLNATMKTTANVDTTLGTVVNGLKAATSTGSTSTVLSDLYGYALDFAFRTNAAESYLLLQTAGAQRVYSDSTSTATMGAGSTMTFQVTTTDAGVATLTPDQVKHLMGAIRVGFVNPNTKAIYGIAALTNIAEGADGFKGELYLHEYEVDADHGNMTLGEKKTEANVDEGMNPAAIMKLDQSVEAALTVIVWLDGDQVDNADVANAAQSLIGSMNLQFSSSAELIPMQNTALENMTITYTELNTTEYNAGVYTYNNAVYKMNAGYKLYRGSDNIIYYSTDESTYTKLTAMNVNTALTPVNIKVDGALSIVKGNTSALTITPNIGTIETATWASGTESVATITNGSTTGATVNALAAGTSKITATVSLKIGEGENIVTLNDVKIEFNVTVTEPAPVVPEEPEEEPETPTTYTVTIETGIEAAMDNVSGISGEYQLPQCTVTNDGYTFSGWLVNNEGEPQSAGTTITVTADITLTAVWTPISG